MAHGDSINAVRVRSSIYLFGNYELNTEKEAGQISRDFLTLVVKSQDAAVSLLLSFKHVVKIEFLDNSEGLGAGMIVYINDYMAQRLEHSFQLDSNGFVKFRLRNGSNYSFIMFDIINADAETIAAVHQVLKQSTEFNRSYLQERFKDSKPDFLNNYNFINPLKFDEWKKALHNLHKDFIVEELTMRTDRREEVHYNCGHIVNLLPGESKKRTHKILHHEVPLKVARSTRQIGHIEISLDDDEHDEVHEHSNSVVTIYKPEDEYSCKIERNDLKTLDPTFMLNDTIIDFYIHYIYYSIPKERRDKIFIFNTFFYSKLCKGVSFPVSIKYNKTRPKKLQDNYTSLKGWTKGVNLFEKDYIIVPINEDTHWYLAVIMNPKAGVVNKSDSTPAFINTSKAGPATNNSTPTVPIFIFDSLIDRDDTKRHRDVYDFLSHYLCLEYREKKEELSLPGCGYRQQALKLITLPGIPQQKNHYDCGIFLLMFVEVFLQRAMKPDELTPLSTFEKLFKWPLMRGKRDEIKKIILGLEQENVSQNHPSSSTNGSETELNQPLTPSESEPNTAPPEQITTPTEPEPNGSSTTSHSSLNKFPLSTLVSQASECE